MQYIFFLFREMIAFSKSWQIAHTLNMLVTNMIGEKMLTRAPKGSQDGSTYCRLQRHRRCFHEFLLRGNSYGEKVKCK